MQGTRRYVSVSLVVLVAIVFPCLPGCRRPAGEGPPPQPTPTPARTSEIEVTITFPSDGDEVDHRTMVRGTVSDPDCHVFVAVLAAVENVYWIQPRVHVDAKGGWSCYAYFGRGESLDQGALFSVVALAAPDERFKEGDKLETLPRDLAQSAPIRVKRK